MFDVSDQPRRLVGYFLKAHYRKNFAEMRLLAFEGKKELKVEAMTLLHQACNSVSGTWIPRCFMKIRFTPTFEETASESDNNAEGIWDRLRAAGLVPLQFQREGGR